jgi:hypothetical protein
MTKVKMILYKLMMRLLCLYVKDQAAGGHIIVSILEAIEMIVHNMPTIKAWLSLLL